MSHPTWQAPKKGAKMAGRRIDVSGDDIISEINIIPLVDISLVLLIIFMVTASYITAASIKVDLPQAVYAKATEEVSTATITISRDGPVYFENQIVTTKQLREKMNSRYRDNPELSVVLSADKAVNFKNVVAVLDMLSELGITKLNISATNE